MNRFAVPMAPTDPMAPTVPIAPTVAIAPTDKKKRKPKPGFVVVQDESSEELVAAELVHSFNE
ncbi:MAG: hypothetical protein EBZ89_10215, partial [Chloroflexi bacterium]|nr:hypothetical protein [Chloroflexota bacterium]